MHGGRDKTELTEPDADAVAKGLPNLEKHLETAHTFGKPAIVVLNKFGTDTDEETDVVRRRCEELGAAFRGPPIITRRGGGRRPSSSPKSRHRGRTVERQRTLQALI